MMDVQQIRAALEPCPAALVIPDELLRSVYEGYGEGARGYHTFAHVVDVLRRYEEVARDVGWRRPREVYLAVLFHDMVYVAGARDNESRSAQAAIGAIEQWLGDAGLDAGYVARLIELTALHSTLTPGDVSEEEALFLDCDTAILGADAAAFDRYEDQVAAEYGAVYPEALYRQGRGHFVEKMLGQERIYLSDYFHGRLDGQARDNLMRSLARIRDAQQ